MTYQAALQKIEQARAEQWEELDLSGMGLTEVPPKVIKVAEAVGFRKFDQKKSENIGNQLMTLPLKLR